VYEEEKKSLTLETQWRSCADYWPLHWCNFIRNGWCTFPGIFNRAFLILNAPPASSSWWESICAVDITNMLPWLECRCCASVLQGKLLQLSALGSIPVTKLL